MRLGAFDQVELTSNSCRNRNDHWCEANENDRRDDPDIDTDIHIDADTDIDAEAEAED